MYKTVEQIGIWHPDKVSDRISDTILGECLKQNKYSRVAVETLIKDNKVIVAEEITSSAIIGYYFVISQVFKGVGYKYKQEVEVNISNFLQKDNVVSNMLNGLTTKVKTFGRDFAQEFSKIENIKVLDIQLDIPFTDKKIEKVKDMDPQVQTALGGLADGETDLLAVAIREVEEETGVKSIKVLDHEISAIDTLPVLGHVKRGKYIPAHIHLSVAYLLEADENEAIRIKADENSNVGWIEVEKVIEMCTEDHMKPLYSKLIKNLMEI